MEYHFPIPLPPFAVNNKIIQNQYTMISIKLRSGSTRSTEGKQR